ncbi:MAG TPA: PrsW family intramembrane metalloprotease [Planctomycetaceae bacterium]|nr:PrsW family intramembrane metalloprotease [Planctomycetaceae bacterium]
MPVFLLMLVCAYGLAVMVYRYDMYDREPWYLLLLAVVLGGGASWMVGGVEDSIIQWLGSNDQTFAQAAIAGVLEEAVKFTIVLAIALLFRSEFNDPLDGLIYGAFAGLGFAIEESRFYIGLAPSGARQIGPEAVRLFLHLLLGGLGGFGLGLARFPKRLRIWAILLPGCLASSMVIHFLWDYWLGLPEATTDTAGFRRWAAVSLMVVTTSMFGGAVVYGVRWSKKILAPLSEKRLWGWPFSLLIRK